MLASSQQSKKPVLFMSVSTGWAIRNFFQTGVVKQLQEKLQLVVLCPSKEAKGIAKLGYADSVVLRAIECGPEPVLWGLVRQLKKKVYMEGRTSSTEQIWEKYRPRPFYQRAGGRMVKMGLRILNARRVYRALEWLDFRINRNVDLRGLFAQYRPVFFFATHATTYFEEYLLRNARAAGVPLAFMVLSWDHLSSKILLHSVFDRILVWNGHTKSEILNTYPSYREEQIRIVGIPQYDFYARKPALTYAEWCKRYGLDPARRTILFSTMPQERHDQQHIIIEELLKAMVAGETVPKDLQLLIKCHPFDCFPAYDEFMGRYPVAIQRSSLTPQQHYEEWLPGESEMEISRDCLSFCWININIFSTVTIEAAYFGKPVIHVAFDPFPVSHRIPCREYYNWDHFKHIVEKDATILVHNFEEMFAAVRAFADNPNLKKEERRKVVEAYIGRPVGSASRIVADELIALIGQTDLR